MTEFALMEGTTYLGKCEEYVVSHILAAISYKKQAADIVL